MKWLKSLELGGVFQETLEEYLITYEYFSDKIFRLDQRIEKLASGGKYKEKVKKHTVLSMIVEVGDFDRFTKPEKFATFLGLVPSEDTSDESRQQYGITKAGNSPLRRLLM